METSFANGGQVSMSGAEPWANPGAPWQILKWLGREDAPLLIRLKADPRLWSWALRFLSQCPPGRTRENTLQILRLAMYSSRTLAETYKETGIEFSQRSNGILHFYTDQADFRSASDFARIMVEQGLRRSVLNVDEILEVEPAMSSCKDMLAGAIHTPDDSSGDARQFALALRDKAEDRGVMFRQGVTIERLIPGNDAIKGIQISGSDGADDKLQADAFVIALGSYSPLVLKPLGIKVPVYPVKGYSATVDVRSSDICPVTSLTDESRKLVFSRLGDKFRIAGTAELTGYDTRLNPDRCRALVDRARQLWPDAGDYDKPEFWTGLRPATPGNVPLIGAMGYSNLFLNTGHGTLGWTLSCGSGKALASLISGEKPEIQLPVQ